MSEQSSVSDTSKAITVSALAIAFILALIDIGTGIDTIPLLNALMPLLVPMGLGGIPLAIAKKAIAARKEIDIEKLHVAAKG